MTNQQLLDKLDELRQLPHETEWVEFKEAKNDFSFDKLGQYFSALANEANLKHQPCGWLVFGIANDDRSICGSRYRDKADYLNSLKHEIANQTNRMSFIDIHIAYHAAGRVIMFQVPAAPPGLPVSFKGHWYGRDGESLVALSLHELEQIRSQAVLDDWSAEICSQATIDDLNSEAIVAARRNFRDKNRNKYFAGEIDSWSNTTLLDKAKLTKNGAITRACLLLLGREEAAYHLEPAVAQITWKLEGTEQAYEHFSPPFLLTTSECYARIRNTMQKLDVPGQLVPFEVPKYEKWVVLEAMHNAIAHQDYRQQARIIVAERPDRLVFESAGDFFEGGLEDYTLREKTPERYRNRFLADAMVNVNMIDTMGYGIRRMFQEQRKRFYPLPDFNLSTPGKVIVTIHGQVIDPNYTVMLMDQKDLPLSKVILLDRIQKRQAVSKDEANMLRNDKLIEGRYPNLYVAAHIASATGDKAQYIKNRAFDDAHYKQMILEFIRKYGHATRQDIDKLLFSKLSDVLDDDRKRNKVTNLIQSMAREDLIRNEGSRKYPKWHLI